MTIPNNNRHFDEWDSDQFLMDQNLNEKIQHI